MPIGSIIGAIGNGFNTFANNEKAKEREAMARSENFRYNEMAADAADARTRKLYADLYSPKAQIEQLKEAGLSPSIYSSGGMAGKSGLSGAQGGGSGGLGPNVFAADPIGAAVAASSIAKTKAETKNIEADTRNKDAENPNIVKNGLLIDAQVKETLASAGYTEQTTQLAKIQTDIQTLAYQIELWKKDEGFTYEMIESEARKLYNDSLISEELYNQANIKTKLENATFKDNVKYVALQNSALVVDMLLKESQITLNNTQAETLIENLILNWFNANVNLWSEQVKLVHMKYQTKIELQKLGVNAQLSQNENEIKILTSLLQSMTSLITMSMLTKGGVPLRPTTTTTTTQGGNPPFPFN